MPEASPFWQNAFLVGVFVLLGWSIWNGWRVGVVRALASLAGLLGGGVVGFGIAGLLAPIVGLILPIPRPVLVFVLGALLALGLYLAVWFLAALLFKRTSQQRSTPLRLVYGLGGAAVGGFVGVTLFWAILFGVRGIGGFWQGDFEVADGRPPNVIERSIVKLKRSIEAGPTGRQIVAADILPPGVYSLLEKMGEFTAFGKQDPEVLDRFYQYPPIADLMRDPAIVAVTSDPDAYDAAGSRNVMALLTNKQILAALNDPALLAKVQKIDLQQALEYALQKSEPAASPASP